MKIAISTDQGYVSAHFGRCPSYTLFEIDGGTVLNQKEISNPGHEPGFLPQFLSERGVQCIIAGGMGPRAQALFAQKNIETIIGVQGRIEDVIQKYLGQHLEAGEDLCEHGHEEGRIVDHRGGEKSAPSLPQRESQPTGSKICVTSLGPDLDSEVDPKFGRAQYFIFYDSGTKTFEAVKNPNLELSHGSGIQTAQMVVKHNVDVVLSGAFGPKATRVLETAGIQMKMGYSGSVKDALANFLDKE